MLISQNPILRLLMQFECIVKHIFQAFQITSDFFSHPRGVFHKDLSALIPLSRLANFNRVHPGAPGRSCSVKGLAGKIAGKMPVDFWEILPSNPPG